MASVPKLETLGHSEVSGDRYILSGGNSETLI